LFEDTEFARMTKSVARKEVPILPACLLTPFLATMTESVAEKEVGIQGGDMETSFAGDVFCDCCK
jgi:hypothetical protein